MSRLRKPKSSTKSPNKPSVDGLPKEKFNSNSLMVAIDDISSDLPPILPPKKSSIVVSLRKNRKKTSKTKLSTCPKKYPEYEIISEIGSGLNFQRKRFLALLEQAIRGNVSEIVVSTSDRFVRFGFNFFEWLFEQFGCKLLSLQKRKFKSGKQEKV